MQFRWELILLYILEFLFEFNVKMCGKEGKR